MPVPVPDGLFAASPQRVRERLSVIVPEDHPTNIDEQPRPPPSGVLCSQSEAYIPTERLTSVPEIVWRAWSPADSYRASEVDAHPRTTDETHIE